jgi:hypothetical protein
VGAGTDATLREFENGVRGRSSRHLDPEGGGGRTRLLFFATAFTTRRLALAGNAHRDEKPNTASSPVRQTSFDSDLRSRSGHP